MLLDQCFSLASTNGQQRHMTHTNAHIPDKLHYTQHILIKSNDEDEYSENGEQRQRERWLLGRNEKCD